VDNNGQEGIRRSDIQRTVTVSSRRALRWVPVPDLGWEWSAIGRP
jgi:hypothetical protein